MTELNDYIELNREFMEVDPERQDIEELRELISYGGATLGALTWSDLWQSQAVVILAEAGAGKTTELRAESTKLTDAGKAAFFIPIEQLASSPLKAAIDVADDARFDTWLSSQAPGYFLLDSVDETRLVNKSFESALKSLMRGLGAARVRAKFAITCRLYDWHWNVDQDAVIHALPKIHVQPRPDVRTGPTEAGLLRPIVSKEREPDAEESMETESPASFRLVALAPLQANQWRIFARARQLEPVEPFVDAIHQSNGEDSASRPLDLEGLIKYWQAHGHLGTRYERLAYDVERRLSEVNPAYQARHELTRERAEQGTEVLAAALTLCKMRSIRLPAAGTDRRVRPDTLDPSVVLEDWSDPEIGVLLHRAMFHGTSYGCVGIHHRNMQTYFAAKYLLRLNRTALSNRELRSVLIGGSANAPVLRPSLASIAGWLALWKPEIFQLLLRLSPETLMIHGDPERLPDSEIASIIEAFCRKYKGRSETGLRLYREHATRLARPSLADVVRQLWGEHSQYTDQRNLLLRIVEHGPIPECVDLALAAALQADNSVDTRQHAMYAIAGAGTDEQKQQLIGRMLAQAATLSTRLSGCLVEIFYPDSLSTDALDRLVTLAPVAERRVWLHDLGHVLEKVLQGVDLEAAKSLLGRWVLLLKQEPYTSQARMGLSRRYQCLVKPVALLCERVLTEEQVVLDEASADAIELVTRAKAYRIDYRLNDAPDLIPMVTGNVQRNAFFFWRSVRRASAAASKPLTDWWQAQSYGQCWMLGPDDVGWLLNSLSNSELVSERQVALSALFSLRDFWDGNDADNGEVRRQVAAVGLEDELLAMYQAASKPSRLSRMDERYRRKQQKQQAQLEQSWREFRDRHAHNPGLLTDPELAKTPEGFSDRYNFVKWLQARESSSDSWGVKDWRLLREGFPEQVVAAARDAIMQYWPTSVPELESEKENPNQHRLYLDVGLSGLNFVAIENPEWARQLSRAEASTAIRYALNERSYFPFWADALFEAHEALAIEIVSTQTDWDFEQPSAAVPRFAVLDTFRYGDLATTERFMVALLERLRQGDPSSPRALQNCLERLMSRGEDSLSPLPSLALERAQRAHETGHREHAALWLSVAVCLVPGEATSVLQSWLDATEVESRGELFVSIMAALFDHDGPRYPANVMRCLNYPHLLALASLCYEYVPISGDRAEDHAYTPNSRDFAQRARKYFLETIVETRGDQSVVALERLARQATNIGYRERLLVLAEDRRQRNAELEALSIGAFRALKRRGELAPQNREDFFSLVVDKVRDVKAYLEGGDDQQKVIIRRERNEHAVQLKLMSELVQLANSLYQVYRESEVADKKSPDFIVSSTSLAAEVAIEAKVSDNNYSARDLANCISGQLIGKYLRDTTRRAHGMVIVTWHGCKKRWRHPKTKRWMDFRQLLAFLEDEAAARVAEFEGAIGVKVIGIILADHPDG